MNFYNDNDPKSAAWLRELIRVGLIPDGVVDTRPIQQIDPNELTPYTQCHFFAGLGGWPLALQLAGWPTSRRCWTGSCPCQPFSTAGKRKGRRDPRHLWPAFRDLIALGHPPVVFGEQVASKDGRGWLSGIRVDLEKLAYAFGAADLCAASVGAPHIRQRLFWVADADKSRYYARPRSGEQSVHHAHGESDRVGIAKSHRCDWTQTGHGQRTRAQSSGEVDRLEHPASDGREQWRPPPIRRSTPGGCGIDRLADAPSLRGPQHEHQPRECPTSTTNHASVGQSVSGPGDAWSDFDILACTDGKSRRIESGVRPLAHGIPGRVGLLRGYGNAIVPQVAAQFIRAFLECESHSLTR